MPGRAESQSGMRIIGVIDLREGRAVHARGGVRERYQPVSRIGDLSIPSGNPEAVARAYVEHLGLSDLYLADLDAIGGRSTQESVIRSIAGSGAALWVDAGISTPEAAYRALGMGADFAVVGLETLPSYAALDAVCSTVGGGCVAFSMDLRGGTASGANTLGAAEAPEYLAARAAQAGVSAVMVIDLARVGTGSGFDLALLGRVRKATIGLTLIAGGGLRDEDDVRRLEDVGCDGVLVATALLEGRLGLRPGG